MPISVNNVPAAAHTKFDGRMPGPSAEEIEVRTGICCDRLAVKKPLAPLATPPAQKPGFFQRVENFFANPNHKMVGIAACVSGMAAIGAYNWLGLTLIPPAVAMGLTWPLGVGLFLAAALIGVAEKK